MNTCFGAGKEPEKQHFFGVNWYDYGARFYDPQIGRWHVIDPLSEAFSSQTPYAYAANNPVLFIDYMGLSPQVGADGLTNEQWIESSRPGTSSEIADSYRTENRNLGIDQNKLSVILGNALNGDVNSLVGSGLKGYYTTNRERDKVYKVHIYGLYELFPAGQAANGGGPYGPDEGFRYGTIDEFYAENKGLTYQQIVTQRGIDGDGHPNGPNMRFVEDPLKPGKYIDMRHMLVVGKQYGSVLGGLGEIAQWFGPWFGWNSRGSALNPQDVYSNNLGECFFFNFNIPANSTQFVDQLRIYLNDHWSYDSIID